MHLSKYILDHFYTRWKIIFVMRIDQMIIFIFQLDHSAVARCQILGGHTVNRDVGYGVHSYINLKILGGHVPVCPPYEYGPDT